MTYFLLLTAGLLFALQFSVNKYYQTYGSDSVSSSILYALLGKAAAVAVFFFCALGAGHSYWGNVSTFAVGVVQAVLNPTIMIVGLYVLSVGSVAMYTVAMMIGGMAVPAVFGILFLGDELRVTRIVAFVLITAAIPLSAKGEKKKITFRAYFLSGKTRCRKMDEYCFADCRTDRFHIVNLASISGKMLEIRFALCYTENLICGEVDYACLGKYKFCGRAIVSMEVLRQILRKKRKHCKKYRRISRRHDFRT